jgi:hypothetical protein
MFAALSLAGLAVPAHLRGEGFLHDGDLAPFWPSRVESAGLVQSLRRLISLVAGVFMYLKHTLRGDELSVRGLCWIGGLLR